MSPSVPKFGGVVFFVYMTRSSQLSQFSQIKYPSKYALEINFNSSSNFEK